MPSIIPVTILIIIIALLASSITTDIIFTVVKISGRDWAGADGFVCICVDLDLEEKNTKKC